MTDSTTPNGSSDEAGLDAVPNAAADDDSAENPPLPDWGPTDGKHGVDGADQNA